MVILACWLLSILCSGMCDLWRWANTPPPKPPVSRGRKVSATRPIPFYPESHPGPLNHWRIS
jgi:hypothetical protein